MDYTTSRIRARINVGMV